MWLFVCDVHGFNSNTIYVHILYIIYVCVIYTYFTFLLFHHLS